MSENNNMFDPLEAWRGMRNATMDAWSKAMIEAVNTDEYAKASGAMLDTYLTASIPFHRMLEEAMTRALQQMNMPTRADFISLSERLTQVETCLDDLDAKIDDLGNNVAKLSTGAPKRKEAK